MGVDAITQEMVAMFLHVSRSYVQGIELGKRPLPDGMAVEAGRLFGVDFRWLLGPFGALPVNRKGKPWRVSDFRAAWACSSSFSKSPFTGLKRAEIGIISESIQKDVEGMLSQFRYRGDGLQLSRALRDAVRGVKDKMGPV